MLPRLLWTPAGALLRHNAFKDRYLISGRRNLVAAPKAGDGPLMQRRPDRELPEIAQPGMRWVRTVPVFLAILIACTLGIFNYQKSSSSVVASTLYALRTSPKARERLGDEIYFADKMPWIWGEMNQLHGRINIKFKVKGTKGNGLMKFKSKRGSRMGIWTTEEWSLEMYGENRRKIDLMDDADPFKGIEMDPDEIKTVGRGSYSPSTSN